MHLAAVKDTAGSVVTHIIRMYSIGLMQRHKSGFERDKSYSMCKIELKNMDPGETLTGRT